MTIKEAENRYYEELAQCVDIYNKKIKKELTIWCVINFILIISGLILIIIGVSAPYTVDFLGYKSYPAYATYCKFYGFVSLPLGSVLLLVIIPSYSKLKKKGPDIFPLVRFLYYDYLKCSDMSEEDKEYYKQRLEDFRYGELINSINNASSDISAVTLFSTLNKK